MTCAIDFSFIVIYTADHLLESRIFTKYIFYRHINEIILKKKEVFLFWAIYRYYWFIFIS